MKKFFIMILTICIILMLTACGNSKSEVVGEYDTSKLGGDFLKSGNEAYAIGTNKEGMPIFKDTGKAFNQALIDYTDGFKAIEEEYDLNQSARKTGKNTKLMDGN